MRTFDQLSPEEQAKAESLALNDELEAVVTGLVSFNDEMNSDDLQARIDRAVEEMEEMQTPWFLAERLMEDEYVAEQLHSLARAAAYDAHYPDPDENIIRLPGAEQ